MARIYEKDIRYLARIDDGTDGSCVYLMQEEMAGPIKIGVAAHANRRLSTHQVGNPRPLKFICVVIAERPDCLAIEKAALLAFKPFKIRGEWFRGEAREPLQNFILAFADASEAAE